MLLTLSTITGSYTKKHVYFGPYCSIKTNHIYCNIPRTVFHGCCMYIKQKDIKQSLKGIFPVFEFNLNSKRNPLFYDSCEPIFLFWDWTLRRFSPPDYTRILSDDYWISHSFKHKIVIYKEKLSYTKIKYLNRNTVLVYVPTLDKSDKEFII